jgi:puromycin-sensitive aminopeptidase
MMTSWTEQMGFPLVKVVKEDWTAESVTLELEQIWFLADGSELDEEGLAKQWTIPILTCNESGPQGEMMLMRQKAATVVVPATKWVKLNAGQEVPMRVLPGAEMLKRLAVGVTDKTLPAIDRAGLLTDAFALVKAKHMAPEALIRLLGNYKDEDSYVVWEGIASALSGLDAVLKDDETINAHFRVFARAIVVNGMKKVGWVASASDGHLTSMLRGILVGLLGSFAYDDESVAAEAASRFKAFKENHDDVQSLPSDIRSPVFKIYLKNGTGKEYGEVKQYYYDATDSAERKHVLGSLGAIPDPQLKLKTMEWATSGEIKLQDFFYLMGSVGHSNSEGRQIAWKYFQDNFETIKTMLANASSSLMDAAIVMCCGGFCSNEKADEIEAFFAGHPVPSSARKISQTLEGMRSNAKFLEILQGSDLVKEDFWSSL